MCQLHHSFDWLWTPVGYLIAIQAFLSLLSFVVSWQKRRAEKVKMNHLGKSKNILDEKKMTPVEKYFFLNKNAEKSHSSVWLGVSAVYSPAPLTTPDTDVIVYWDTLQKNTSLQQNEKLNHQKSLREMHQRHNDININNQFILFLLLICCFQLMLHIHCGTVRR